MRTRFPRVLGLFQVTASGVAIIIGAGIYVLVGSLMIMIGGVGYLVTRVTFSKSEPAG